MRFQKKKKYLICNYEKYLHYCIYYIVYILRRNFVYKDNSRKMSKKKKKKTVRIRNIAVIKCKYNILNFT